MPPFVYSSPDAGFWDTLVVLSLSETLDGPDSITQAPASTPDAQIEPNAPELAANIDSLAG